MYPSRRSESVPLPLSGLQAYLQDISKLPLLSRREEVGIAERIARGDAHARDELVRSNLRLVVRIARDYSGRGLPLEDLIEDGNLGLMRAVEGYDGTRGVRFSTYASFWIKQSIRSSLAKHGHTLPVPNYVQTLLGKWRRVRKALTHSLGREPKPAEVLDELNLTPNHRASLEAALVAHAGPWRNGEQPEGDLSDPLSEQIDERLAPPVEACERAELLERIAGRLGQLEERAAAVIRLRYGLIDGRTRTFREIGEELGLTRQWVRKLESRALRALARNAG
jgi:RNA polymerase primary sigma factor